MRIHVHARGGLSVYGGHYDPHRHEAIIERSREDETVALTIEYPSAPTSPSVEVSGISCTTPAVTSGTNKVTATLSGLDNNGYADISATVGGALKKIRIATSSPGGDAYSGSSDEDVSDDFEDALGF